ncbi:glycoside hydrolase family protein [Enterobacter bugandensis]|uniref:glycoside hydrolase family protein n=1 Tax=Enterobacter bugandensis TaxID=881260 RepID=UPI003BCC4BF0
MSGIEDSNQGAGWNDHDTPYGPIHSYDGNDHSYGGSSGGNGGGHSGIDDKSTINIASTSVYNGTMMSMCVNNLKKHEGFKNTMYKDTAGNITVGIGHLLANAAMAASLPFTRTNTIHAHGDDIESEVSISKGDITSAFNAFKTDSKKAPLNMHLSNDAIIGQCISDVQTTVSGLKGLYAGFDSFPNSAKTALVDMGFNLGIPRLHSEFPKFNSAVNRKDWNTAANESHRTGIGEGRNNDTKGQLQQAASGH